VWLVGALPTALSELRTLADVRQAETEEDDPEVRDLRVRVQALHRQLAGTKRRSLFTLIRVIKLVRSPATQALQLTRGSISSVERIEMTAQVVDRSAGLPVLAVGTAVGSLLAWVVARDPHPRRQHLVGQRPPAGGSSLVAIEDRAAALRRCCRDGAT
jgi:hypothetical protein